LSPLTSGFAAMSVLTSTTSNLLFEYVNWPLVRLVSLLFVGIMGREISMDINDTEDDSAHAVRTVPVVYGRPYASHIAWLSSLVVAGLAVSGPVLLTESVDPFVTLRRAALAGVGSLLQMRRYWTVAKTEGEDAHAIEVAVDEGLLSLVLLLASFV
jgi:4-hydroxybenzoate polyprenyltransferase